MRRILFACALMFSLLFGTSAAYADTATDPCLGPRGDKTFTPTELLDLFTIETIPADDGHNTHYRTALSCEGNGPWTITLTLSPQENTIRFKTETHESYSYQHGTGVKSNKTPSMALYIELPDVKKKMSVTHDGQNTEMTLVLSSLTDVELMTSPWGGGQDKGFAHRAAQRFTALVKEIRRTAGKEQIILKGITMRPPYVHSEVCSLKDPFLSVWPLLRTPHQVFVGDKLVWEEKQ